MSGAAVRNQTSPIPPAPVAEEAREAIEDFIALALWDSSEAAIRSVQKSPSARLLALQLDEIVKRNPELRLLDLSNSWLKITDAIRRDQDPDAALREMKDLIRNIDGLHPGILKNVAGPLKGAPAFTEILKGDAPKLTTQGALGVADMLTTTIGVYMQWKADTVDSNQSFAEWARVNMPPGVDVAFNLAGGAVVLGIAAATGPAGAAMLVGLGVQDLYGAVKGILEDYLTGYPSGEFRKEAEAVLKFMEDFEDGLSLISDALTEVFLMPLQDLLHAYGEAHVYQHDKDVWLIGRDASVLIGAETNSVAVHMGHGQILGNGGDDMLIGFRPDTQDGNFLLIDGGAGDDLLMSIGGEGSILIGGAGEDHLVAVGGRVDVWGGDGSGRNDGAEDVFTIMGGEVVIYDAGTEDYVNWGPFRLTGGVQQSWMEAGWAYWTPFSSLLSGMPLPFLSTFGALSVLMEISSAAAFRYGLTTDGDLLVEFGLGRLGTLTIKDYQLDLNSGVATAHIVAFRQEIVEPGQVTLGDFENYVNLALKAGFGVGLGGADPLVLDLDGDGLEFKTRGSTRTYFDLDGDGFAERTSWFSGDDGFLARDLDGDGRITHIGELFGDASTSGFEALRKLDSNKDGKITAADQDFSSLRIWRDLDGDGETDPGELKTLAQSRILSISLDDAPPNAASPAGGEIRAQASFTRSDGSTSVVADVLLDVNQTDSRLLNAPKISAAAAALPELKGYGDLADLRIAMTQDGKLLDLVKAFANLKETTSWSALQNRADDVLFRWAGVEAEAVKPMGAGFDTRKLAFLEAYFGYELTPRDAQGVPSLDNLEELVESWNDVLGKATLRLAVQGPLKTLLDSQTYHSADDRLFADHVSTLSDAYAEALKEISSLSASAALARWKAHWAPLLEEFAEALVRHDKNEIRTDFAFQSLVRAQDLSKSALDLGALVKGLGWEGVQIGGARADSLTRAGEGLRVYYGGAGNDRLEGGSGQDVYVYGRGFGQDVIVDSEDGGAKSGDRIRFALLRPEDLVFSKNGEDLVIRVKGSTDQITVKDQFAQPLVDFGGRPLTPNFGVEEIQFADGTIYEAGDVAALVGRGTNKSETIRGSGQDDHIEGLKGDDKLYGGDGGDTYYFTRGDGNDVISDEMTNPLLKAPDSLLLLGGIKSEDLRLSRIGDDLMIRFAWSGDSVRIKNQFAYGPLGYETKLALDSRIEAFFFEGGGAWSWLDLQAQMIAASTTDGTDVTHGFGTSDSFKASPGNDRLYGYDGGDVYRFGRGSGKDLIHDQSQYPETFVSGLVGYSWGADDVVEFGPGLTAADVTFERRGEAPDLLIRIKGTEDQLTIKGQFNGIKLDLFNLLGMAWFDRIESFKFADGSALSWEQVLREVTTGGAGNDKLYGAYHPDVMDGKGGNDWLSGGDDGDTYVFGRGYGKDVIEDRQTNVLTTNPDRVLFQAGVSVKDVIFERAGRTDDLRIRIKGTEDSLVIKGHYDVVETGVFGTHAFNRIEEFHWADGTVKFWDEIERTIIAEAKTAGDDYILGTNSGDLLDGGAGNDTLIGRGGNDTYVFGLGYGRDVVHDQRPNILSASDDRVLFGEGVELSEVSFSRPRGTDDLQITLKDGSRLTIKEMFTVFLALGQYEFNRIESFEFQDRAKTKLDSWQVQELLLKQASTDGNDYIEGFMFADVLDGGKGNDTLVGGGGGDTYVFGLGYGRDVIHDQKPNILSDGDDRVLFRKGVELSETSFSRPRGTNDLQITLKDGSRLTIKEMFQIVVGLGQYEFNRIEFFEFQDRAKTKLDSWQIQELLLKQASTDGNDYIEGFSFTDVLEGGKGNDHLLGGDGSDVYIFRPGFGRDVIHDQTTYILIDSHDVILFEQGFKPSDLILERREESDDLVIRIKGAKDQITVKDHFGFMAFHRIEEIKFHNGVSWDVEQIEKRTKIIPLPSPPTPVLGSDKADVLNGTARADILDGLSGNDRLKGGAGNDILYGRDGDDQLTGGKGNDHLEGGRGSDTYHFAPGDGRDVIRDESGASDRLIFGKGIAPAKVAVSFGDEGWDLVLKIAGSSDQVTLKNAVFYQDARIESVRFADGTNWSYAALWAKAAAPTSGHDRLWGDERANLLKGGAGNDRLYGRDGDDQLTGGKGNDHLEGGWGSDVYHFAPGDGRDVIIEDGGASDRLIFGKGIDPAKVKVSFGDEGWDLVLKIAGSSDQVTLKNAVFYQDARIESVRFADGTVWSYAALWAKAAAPTSGHDRLWGDERANVLRGGAGNDRLYGRDGNDQLTGGKGNDHLQGGWGSDTYHFAPGDGRDVIIEEGGASDRLIFGKGIAPAKVAVSFADEGQDLVLKIAGTTDQITLENAVLYQDARLESVRFADGTVWSYAALWAKAATATSGHDRLWGDERANLLKGGAGNDKLYGRDGDDVLRGGGGADLLDGGYGEDQASYAEATAAVKVDLADAKANTGEAKGDSYASIENLQGSKFNDDLRGDAEANAIWGGAGNDVIHGQAGNDQLYGEGGDDRILGGLGRDFLYGGAGKDVFIFLSAAETSATASRADVVMDFTRGQDRLDFSAFDSNASASGRQKFSGLIEANAVFTQAGQLRFDPKTNMLYGNTDRDAEAEFAIKLQNVISLSNDDFLF